MSSAKKKAKAKSAVKFKDLESKKSPKGGPIYITYSKSPTDSHKATAIET
jgi:hypothetical protein